MTPRSERTSVFVEAIEQEWSEYYCQFMTKNDGHLFHLDQEGFTSNTNITLKTIENHPEYEWSYEGIMRNPNLTWTFLKKLKNGMFADNEECLILYRMNSLYYDDDYEAHADLREKGMGIKNMKKLERNFNETDFGNYDVYLDSLTSPYMLPKHFKEFNMECCAGYIAHNPNMTIEFLKELVDGGFKFNSIIYNPAQNGAFTYTDIVNNPQIPWRYEDFGINSSLRFNFIENNETIADGRDYLNLVSYNKFTVEKEAFLYRRRREYLAAYRIQQWWWRVTSHPANPVCRRRLERHYAEMLQATPN
jgi:hypothetical protein